MPPELPAGRVTFVFTDVVGSTRLMHEHGPRYVEALQALQADLAASATRHGGVVVSTEGDGTFLAFPSAAGAVVAVASVQAALEESAVPLLRIRAGAHTGEATPVGRDYLAFPVHVAARVSGAAAAGQLLVSQDVIDDLDPGTGTRLGAFALKDIPEPVTLWRLRGDGTPPRATPARRTNVEEPRTSFVGRVEELAALLELVRGPGLVSIVGTGGLGKTRLVRELALRHHEALAGGAWFVELAPTSGDQVHGSVAAVVGLPEDATYPQLASEVRRRGELLLLLDNCEHVLDATAELVDQLLTDCPELRVVTTSREPLALDGERVLRVRSLDVSTDALTAGAAEQLFLARASTAGGDVDPTMLPVVSAVCARLDGLPLALELAAAQTATMPLDGLLAALTSGEIVLRRRGGAERQRSLDDLVRWSLRLVTPEELDGLLRLAVFPGAFPVAAAEAVLGPGAMRIVASLGSRSLLEVQPNQIDVLVTIRDVARRELSERPDLELRADEALFQWVRTRAEDWFRSLDNDDVIDRSQVAAVEQALTWGLRRGSPGCGYILHLLRAWGWARGLGSARQHLAELASLSPLAPTADSVLLRLNAWHALSGGQGRWHASAAEVRRFVDVAREVDDVRVLHLALGRAGDALSREGLHAEALALLQESVTLAEGHLEVRKSLGVALLNLAIALHLQGDVEGAKLAYEQSAAACREAGDVDNVSIANLNYGELLVDMRRFQEAEHHLVPVIRESTAYPVWCAGATALLVEALLGQGRRDEALTLLPEAEGQLTAMLPYDVSLTFYLDRVHAAMQGQPVP